MPNLLHLTALLSPVLVTLIAESAWSCPPIGSNYPAHKAANVNFPCFMQTSDGKVLNLDSLCGRKDEQKGEPLAAPSNENSKPDCFERSEQQPAQSEDEPESETEEA